MHYPDPQRVEMEGSTSRWRRSCWTSTTALKSGTKRGNASLDYDFSEYRNDDLVKLDILIVNGDQVDAFSVTSTAPRRRSTVGTW